MKFLLLSIKTTNPAVTTGPFLNILVPLKRLRNYQQLLSCSFLTYLYVTHLVVKELFNKSYFKISVNALSKKTKPKPPKHTTKPQTNFSFLILWHSSILWQEFILKWEKRVRYLSHQLYLHANLYSHLFTFSRIIFKAIGFLMIS